MVMQSGTGQTTARRLHPTRSVESQGAQSARVRDTIGQILINLVENSLKFGAAATRKEIVVFAGDTGGGVRFGVRDTGPGLGEKALGRIFDDFTRGDDPVTLGTKGTGIGLALVRRLAQAMGGRAEARNNREAGCTVAVVLSPRCSSLHRYGKRGG
jgi:signal transduction histidine kinase